MKLPIKKKYFEEIKAGSKKYEFRDAHLTFVCEETGEQLRKDIVNVSLIDKGLLCDEYRESAMFEDDIILAFELK